MQRDFVGQVFNLSFGPPLCSCRAKAKRSCASNGGSAYANRWHVLCRFLIFVSPRTPDRGKLALWRVQLRQVFALTERSIFFLFHLLCFILAGRIVMVMAQIACIDFESVLAVDPCRWMCIICRLSCARESTIAG